jgi:poly(3-hydroxybutyrate) depolymerase
METHGTADKTVPYEGGKGAGGPLPAIPDWLSRWAKRNKCEEPKTSDKGKGVTLQQWKCGGKENALRHWKLKDQGHDYPGRNNEHMWLSPKIIEFFNAHKKP